MSWEGLQPTRIARFGGGVDWDDPTQIPVGLAAVCKNSSWRAESVFTRYGLRHSMTSPHNEDITGVDVLNTLEATPKQIGVVFGTNGLLYKENPPGSGTLVPVGTPVAPPTNAYMQDAIAYNRIYMSFTNLNKGLSIPIVLDGPSGTVDTISQTVIGGLWTPGTQYQLGDLVRTSSSAQRFFVCTLAGVAGPAEPQWPTLDGYFNGASFVTASITDPNGTSQWEEWTPGAVSFIPQPELNGVVSSVKGQAGAPGGTISAAQDVYIFVSYKNSRGETAWTGPYPFVNTAANDVLALRFQFNGEVPGPTVPYVFGAAGYGGPRMPQWFASVMGTTGNPSTLHGRRLRLLEGLGSGSGNREPVPYFLWTVWHHRSECSRVIVTSIPGATTAIITQSTAALSSQLFLE